MTQAALRISPRRVGNYQPQRRVVSVVPTRPRRARPSVVVVASIIVLIAIISVPLLMNTQMAMLSYRIHDDQVRIATLKEDNQQLQTRVNEKASAASLRKAASDAGLVPAGAIGFITLKTQKIEGGTPATPPVQESSSDDKDKATE
ncbi:MAG: hypothetical protein Q4P66_01640 [Actinomycetaceae bacterium]|nr:hypothetical protein [Actinomycetaceae bacterium]